MKPLRHNSEILAFAAERARTGACARAIRAGDGIEVIPRPEIYGWEIRAKAKFGMPCDMIVRLDYERQRFIAEYIEADR